MFYIPASALKPNAVFSALFPPCIPRSQYLRVSEEYIDFITNAYVFPDISQCTCNSTELSQTASSARTLSQIRFVYPSTCSFPHCCLLSQSETNNKYMQILMMDQLHHRDIFHLICIISALASMKHACEKELHQRFSQRDVALNLLLCFLSL